jgi:hypothetical protein
LESTSDTESETDSSSSADSGQEETDSGDASDETGAPEAAMTEGLWFWENAGSTTDNGCGDWGIAQIGMYGDKLWRVESSDANSIEVTDWWWDPVECVVETVDGQQVFDCTTSVPQANLNPQSAPALIDGLLVGEHHITGILNGPDEAYTESTIEIGCEGDACADFATMSNIEFPCTMVARRLGYPVAPAQPFACDAFASELSGANGPGVHTMFYNATDVPVESLWIDFSGELVSYGWIQPYTMRRDMSFANHSWVFEDVDANCHGAGRLDVGEGAFMLGSAQP